MPPSISTAALVEVFLDFLVFFACQSEAYRFSTPIKNIEVNSKQALDTAQFFLQTLLDALVSDVVQHFGFKSAL